MDFDRHCTSPARLAIISSLVSGQALSFTELKRATGLADGNLHVQTAKLADAGYVQRSRESGEGRPRTYFRLTGLGMAAFRLHVRKLQGLLEAEKPIRGVVRPAEPGDDSRVW